MSDERKGLGAGWVVTLLGAITGAVSVALGFMLKRSLGVVLVIMAVVFAVGSIKGDLLGMFSDWQQRQEASEIRKLEFEREKLRLESEERKQRLKAEAEQRAREQRLQEQERAKQASTTETVVRTDNGAPKAYTSMNWVRSNRGNIANGTQYDSAENVTVVGGVVTIPTKKEFVNPDPDHSGALSVFYRVEYYCESQRKRTVDIRGYSGSNGTGELLFSRTRSDWIDIKHWDPACRDYLRK
jgi:hypothetical protein